MPFSHVRSSYQPEQLDKLTEAFNLVWPQVVSPMEQQLTYRCMRKPGRVRA